MQPFSYFPQYGGNFGANAGGMNVGGMNAPMYQQQNSGFIRVQNEMQAREYPVAPGNSVTFISETEPYFYTKTTGSNPFEASTFKIYRLVEEEQSQNAQNSPQSTAAAQGIDLSDYAHKADIAAISAGYDSLRAEVENIKARFEKMRAVKADAPRVDISKNAVNLEYDGVDD